MYPKCKVKVWDNKICDVLSMDGEYVIISTLLTGNAHPSKFELHIDDIEMIPTETPKRIVKVKNYKLFKLRLAKTGVVFGVNKFGHRWIELWYRGKFIMIDAKQFKRVCAEEWEFLKTGKNPLKQDPTPIQVYLYKGEVMGKNL